MIDPRPTDMFRAGDLLNNTYEVQGVLGRGGTGEVYRVVNKLTGRVFAVKALNSRFAGNEDYVELMKREEEMRAILHEAVVRYNECWRIDSGAVILVMDYIPGPSLADAMVARQMSEKELLVVGHRIARGLEAAHGHGIVHRDMSPDNIILKDGAPDQATIIDFGIAKDTAEGARTIVGNDFAGKYEYAAPEQLDGKAEAASDLYALGATLLAAYRQETPYLGTTPGEIVRRKNAPLDTDGVPERLKHLIEALSAPEIEDRPQSARAAVTLIDQLLEDGKVPRGGRAASSQREPTRRGGRSSDGQDPGRGRGKWLALAAVAVVAALGVGGYVALAPGLPTVSPYTLSAQKAVEGRTQLTGHAPDDAGAALLIDAFVAATGAPSAAATVTLANTVPAEDWPRDLGVLMEILKDTPRWGFEVSDSVIDLTALAPDLAASEALGTELLGWAEGSALTLNTDITAGPEVLSAAEVASVLSAHQTCGPLIVAGDRFALGAAVPISGNIAEEADEAAVAAALRPVIGSRTLSFDFTVLNPDVCKIRDVLPAAPASALSIWLGNGEDMSANLTGIFNTGDNPVADVLIPGDLSDAYLWVMVVDNDDKAFHILPNVNDSEMRLENLGALEGGVRRVRVLYPRSIFETDTTKLVVEVLDDSYGKSEIVAILTRTPLFEVRRPSVESVAALNEALTETLSGRETDVIGIVSRFIDARP